MGVTWPWKAPIVTCKRLRLGGDNDGRLPPPPPPPTKHIMSQKRDGVVYVGLMLSQRRRRSASIKPTFG